MKSTKVIYRIPFFHQNTVCQKTQLVNEKKAGFTDKNSRAHITKYTLSGLEIIIAVELRALTWWSLDKSISMMPDAKVGDYVLVHAGVAISIVDVEEAKKSLIYCYKWAKWVK